MRHARPGPIFPALLAGLLATGCQQEQGEDILLGEYAEERAEPEEFAGPEQRPGGGAVLEVEVVFDERSIALARDTVDAGRHVLIFINQTTDVTTECTVAGAGREMETDTVPPRGGASLQVELEPGTYAIECPILMDQLEAGEERSVRTVLVVR